MSNKQGYATIIGGHGFIGSYLAKRLSTTGWRVWIPEKNDPKLFSTELGTVFYCAGLTADYKLRSFDVIDAHVTMLSMILHHAKYDRLTYLSSTRLYDSYYGDIAVEEMDLALNSLNPRHIYDISKALGESLCNVVDPCKTKIARLSCVFDGEINRDGFLSYVLMRVRAAMRNGDREIIIDTSRELSRDYICINDVVSGLILISDNGSGIYNIASGENISNSAIFSLIDDVLGIKIIASQDFDRQINFNHPKVSISKMRNEFNWIPSKALDLFRSYLLKL